MRKSTSMAARLRQSLAPCGIQPLLPVILLVTIAAAQFVQAINGTLTPWKGGGFGMFATLDSIPHRFLLITGIGPAGQRYLVAPRSWPALAHLTPARLRAVLSKPTLAALDELALRILSLSWRPEEPARLRPRELMSPLDGDVESRLMAYRRLIRAVGSEETVELMEVHVQVRRLDFGHGTSGVTLSTIGPIGIARGY